MSVNRVNSSTGALSPIAGGTLYADAPVGSIQAYGGTTAPFGWLLCQGQAVSRSTYADLFGVIGTSFGAGDGSTTFNVPDLRGKVPVGLNSSDTEFDALGKTGGEKTHLLTQAEMPAHGHTFTGGWGAGSSYAERFAYGSVANKNDTYGIGTAGGSQAHNNLQPYNTVNYIIKATSLALPTDFADAVDEKIEDNIVDSITDGSMKAATSNAVANALPKYASGTTSMVTVSAGSYIDVNISFPAGLFSSIPNVVTSLRSGNAEVTMPSVWNSISAVQKPNFSKDGGSVTILNNSNVNLPIYISWIAIL